MKRKMCMLEDNKTCDNCCECDTCDLNPTKVCDNCAKCISSEEGFRSFTVKDLFEVEESYKKFRLKKTRIIRRPPQRNNETESVTKTP